MAQPSAEDQLREGRRALEAARWEAAPRGVRGRARRRGDAPTRTTASARRSGSSATSTTGSPRASGRSTRYVRERPLRRGGARRASGSRTSTSSRDAPRPRAAGSRAPSARSRAPAPCAGHGWVAVERARHAETVEECVEHARRAMAIARETGAADLEVFALSLLGRAEVSAGRREEGMPLLEEAMAAASAGRVRNVHTLGEAYCNLITACTSAGDWERATEWCELVDEFAREHGVTPLFGACRTVHADVLLATGRWPEAERALESALATHARYVPEMGAPTVGDDGRAARPPGPPARGRAAARRPRGAPVVAARARAAADRGGPAAGGRRAARARAGGRRRTTRCGPRSCSRRSSTRASRAATSAAPSAAARRLAELARSSGHPARRGARRPGRRARGARAGERRRGRRAGEPGARRVQPARRCRSTPARRGSSSPARWPRDAPDLARDEARTRVRDLPASSAPRARWTPPRRVLRELGRGHRGRARAATAS